jgi:cyanophycinase-like exopeptidase
MARAAGDHDADADRSRVDGPLSAVAVHGLGLITGAIVEQHFDGRGGRLDASLACCAIPLSSTNWRAATATG